ncbi:MAG: DNA mismatch repair endonuclease MutL [Lachnospiraceae bacterium]|nr:DNA mismatch repair endonuclease MutL [Lachnospiraceae bacterium]
MPNIEILDQQTIDKIAAGEVIERPSSVVKELVENAIDAKASAITVEIKEGGISFIRITDNGCGIEKEQVPLAFLRHSTSKIRNVEDLLTVSSLGFRGEALFSIAAVSQVELITKTVSEFTGTRYVIEGGKEKSSEEIGAPEGTTFLVRNLFYNTPARKKFLKTAQTEAGYIGDLMERLALSHPEISFKLIVNNQPKLHTSGNSNLKEVIYHIYGRDIAANLLEVQGENEWFSIQGFIGKPLISRGNRNFENYFINGRYIMSSLIAKSIEEGYKSFVMQHKYPFTVLQISINGNLLDVNVHPTKMELRFSNGEEIYQFLTQLIRDAINQNELVYQVSLEQEREEKARREQEKKERMGSGRKAPEPFETKRLEAVKAAIRKDSPYEPKYEKISEEIRQREKEVQSQSVSEMAAEEITFGKQEGNLKDPFQGMAEQQNHLFPKTLKPTGSQPRESREAIESQSKESRESSGNHFPEAEDRPRKLLEEASRSAHKIIGQLFDTYWLVEFDNQLYIIDQHAAHEKVLYERTLKALENKEFTSQVIYPPILLTLNMQEESLLKKYMSYFQKLGYEIEHFGGKEYSVTAVPGNLFGLSGQGLVIEILDSLADFHGKETPQMITEKIASMSCKAAVKGNQSISRPEVEALIGELLTLENPYHCPHGRPTIISMTKYELEKKFKRVL